MVLGVTFLTLSYPYEATKRIVPSTLETKIAKKRPLSTSEIKSFEQKFALKAVDSKLLQLKLNLHLVNILNHLKLTMDGALLAYLVTFVNLKYRSIFFHQATCRRIRDIFYFGL